MLPALVGYHFAGEIPYAFLLTRNVFRLLRLGGEKLSTQALQMQMENLHTLYAAPKHLRGPYVQIATEDGVLLWNQGLDYDRYEIEDGIVYAFRRRDWDATYGGEGSKPGGTKRRWNPALYEREAIGRVVGDLYEHEIGDRRDRLRRELYGELVEPILAAAPEVRRLTILPEGGAYRLPFAFLMDSSGRTLEGTHAIEFMFSP